jgi:hypothetical protein
VRKTVAMPAWINKRRTGYQRDVDTGFFIHADRHVYGPGGRTAWWVRRVGAHELVEGREGQTGFQLRDGRLVTVRGTDTGFHVVAEGGARRFHGPASLLPWMPQPQGALRPPTGR